MPSVEVVEDSASEGERKPSPKKSDSNAQAPSEDEPNRDDSPSEYEIEAILDAKHGAFPGVRPIDVKKCSMLAC